MNVAFVRRQLGLALTALCFALLSCVAVVTAAHAAPAGSVAQVDEQDPDVEDEEVWEEDSGFEDDELFADDEELLEEESAVDAEVVAIQQATGELGRAKRAAAGKVAKLGRGATVLRSCLRAGPGWKRIRSIDHAPQRRLYAAAARKLLADMRRLLDGQQPRILAFDGAFERFVAQLRAAPVSDPTLRDAIGAQGRRLAAYRDVRGVKAGCGLFNKLTGRVREFPTRSAAQIVRADYRAAPIARRIERAISGRLEKIDRRHGIDFRDAETLAEAAEVMVELGGEPGYATGFQYALSLR